VTSAQQALELCGVTRAEAERRRGLQLARPAFAAAPDQVSVARVLARCAFAVSELETDRAVIKVTAREGMAAAQRSGGDDDPEAAYLYALNLGLLMRADMKAALGRVPELVAKLEVARSHPELEQGGPLRVHGMLYLRAPPWPASIGDLEAALELLEAAVQQFPEHPQNHLFLAQVWLEDGDAEAAAAALDRAEKAIAEGDWGAAGPRWQAEIEALRGTARK